MTKLAEQRAILIVGGTGNIGSCLTQQIVSNTDYIVAVLVRDEVKARAMFGDAIETGRIKLFLAKQLSCEDLQTAMDGIDVVVWCVGPRSRSRILDLISASPDSSKSVDYLAVQHLCDAAKKSATLQRIIMIEPPQVERPFRIGTIIGNLTQNYLYYWKAHGECIIKGSGLDYTIIRPHQVQCNLTSMHRSVSDLSFHQGRAPLFRLRRYPPIPIASLTDVITETIERLEQTRRCTFEVSGDPSQAKTWDDLFEKLKPDHETKPKSIVTKHSIGIGFGIACSLAAAVGISLAFVKYTGYDQNLQHFFNKSFVKRTWLKQFNLYEGGFDSDIGQPNICLTT